MKVQVEHLQKMQFRATTGSGHSVLMDASPPVGGENAGARPMEMVLVGLGGCSAIDVMLILQKSRQAVQACVVDIAAERRDQVPAVFSSIHLHYTIRGPNLAQSKVERAVRLSMQKYCSVTRMLAETAEMTHSLEVVSSAT